MFRVKRESVGWDLHEGSRWLLAAASLYAEGNYPDFENPEHPATKAFARLSKALGKSNEDKLFVAINKELYREEDLPKSEIRTIFTRVMQRLGYDGIDTRGKGVLDTGAYGSVIFVKQK